MLVCVRVSGQSHAEESAVPRVFLSCTKNTPHPILSLTETCQGHVWWTQDSRWYQSVGITKRMK